MATLTLTIETTGESSTLQTTDAKAAQVVHAILGGDRYRTVTDPETGEASQVELTNQEKLDLFMQRLRAAIVREAQRTHVQTAEVEARSAGDVIRQQARDEARGLEF